VIHLKLTIAPDKQDENLVEFHPDFEMKKPRRTYAHGYGYITRDYKLSKEDPAQLDLLEQRRLDGIAELHASDAALERVGRGGS
jgi:hypothetical protein